MPLFQSGAMRLGAANKFVFLGLAGLTLCLGACEPKTTRVDPIAADRASALCAAMDTAAEVKAVIFDLAEKQTAASNRLALTQLAKQANVLIEAPLLDSYDADSKTTICSGQLHISLPAGAVRNLGDTNDLTKPIKYSAAPANDHISVAYKVIGADTLISGIAGADISDWASRLTPAGMPAEGAPAPATVSAAAPPYAPPPEPIMSLPSQTSPAPAAKSVVTAKRPPPKTDLPSAMANGFADLPPMPRCRWARSYADRMICGDPALEAEDRRIGALYRLALANDATGEVRRVAQSERAAREGCQDRDCILEWFRQREADLSPR
jgi:hypothetical protein